MSENPREFPNVANKLSAPSKKSIFERQKAEAEAKRLKEEEETAAVYADFVKSFDDDPGHDDGSAGIFASDPGRSSTGVRHQVPGGPGKRHFTGNLGTPQGKPSFGGGSGRLSGPGSLGPPPSLSRKRTFDGAPPRDVGSRQGRLGFEGSDVHDKLALGDSDGEDRKDVKSKEAERAASKPTLKLTYLPPMMSSTAIKAMFPSSVKVDFVQMLPDSNDSTERKSKSAIVTLGTDTPASEIESLVSTLQKRYLGWGYYLNLSRHLSSAVSGIANPIAGVSSSGRLPFGAKAPPAGPSTNLSRAPPPGAGRGFAPPASYGPMAGGLGRGVAAAQVEVCPPTDLKQLKLVHKTVENVISHGPEFEALLMSRPSVQKEEKWAWIWDARSPGGVWYRWRLWDILTNAQQRIRKGNGRNDNPTQIVFLGGVPWSSQERALAFEYDNDISQFVSDTEYDSTEDEDSGDEGRRRLQHLQGGTMPTDQAESDLPHYLNPLHKAKLVHLLARLPSSTARLRRGDIARITAFAIKHASEGADEVVELIVQNVHTPFSLTGANPDRKKNDDDTGSDGANNNPDGDASALDKDLDISSIKLVSLYAISDILSSSSTSGVRHAWRYRQLFEGAIRKNNTFAHLGRLEKELSWGRMRTEKFKRSVNTLLSLWEGWCVFPIPAQEELSKAFNEPPLTEKEKQEARQKEVEEERARKAANNKWRAVDEQQISTDPQTADVERGAAEGNDIDGEPMAEDDEDIDGVPMEEDSDVDGEAMAEDDELPAQAQKEADNRPDNTSASTEPGLTAEHQDSEGSKPIRMRRPKAEDMFLDS